MAPAETMRVPEGFLDGPAPCLEKSHIDWVAGGLPGYDGRWAVVLDGVLTEEECQTFLAAAESTTDGRWERALVNVGNGRQAMYEDIRNCGRIIWDDRAIVAKLWARIERSVPEIHRLENWGTVTGIGPIKRNEVWKVSRLNERMRFLKYIGGEYFKSHSDGTYETPDKKERSYFTLQLYLNNAVGREGQEPLEGGNTQFEAFNTIRTVDVEPKSGRVLLFQHRDLMHSGEDVISGTKFTMRTDIMYMKEEAGKEANE